MGGIHHDQEIYSSTTNTTAAGYYNYNGEGVPLNDATRTLVVIIHYVAIPFVTFALYGIMKNVQVIEKRIWSPFLLVTAMTWLMMATSFEISNHFYVNDWELYDPKSDLINASFFFFNFGAQNLMAISLRKKGVPFIRNGSSCLDWTTMIVDPILAVLIVINPIVYGIVGRSTAVQVLSPLASIAGVFTLFRVWYNLGPNMYTRIGGILFFVLVLNGVAMNVVYNSINDEWVHALIGGSFISSTIPLGVAFLNAELESSSSDPPKEEDDDDDEMKKVNVNLKDLSEEGNPIYVDQGTDDTTAEGMNNNNNKDEDVEQ